MNFEQGASQTNDVNKQIAFWKYTIDVHALLLEQCPEIDWVDQEICFQGTGCDTIESFDGAVRSGFMVAINALPPAVREPVYSYLVKRMTISRQRVGDHVMDKDLLFGTGDP